MRTPPKSRTSTRTVSPHEGDGGKLWLGDAASGGEQLEHLHQYRFSAHGRLGQERGGGHGDLTLTDVGLRVFAQDRGQVLRELSALLRSVSSVRRVEVCCRPLLQDHKPAPEALLPISYLSQHPRD